MKRGTACFSSRIRLEQWWRRALLDCYLDETGRYHDEHWSRLSSLCLFAPAHSGANILRLIGETLSTLGIPIGPVLKQIYPCLQDLEEGCTALTALRDDYRSLPEFSPVWVPQDGLTHVGQDSPRVNLRHHSLR